MIFKLTCDNVWIELVFVQEDKYHPFLSTGSLNKMIFLIPRDINANHWLGSIPV